MAKLNGVQNWLILSGLELQRSAMKAEIEAIEATGRNAIMTLGYVDQIINDSIEEVNKNTLAKALKNK